MTKQIDELMHLADEYAAHTVNFMNFRSEVNYEAVTSAKANLRQALEAALKPGEAMEDKIGSEWAPCVKLPITVHVRKQREGEKHSSTREGITPVKPDDLIMRGVAGEEYPIGRELFERTYRLGEAPARREPLSDEQIADLFTQHKAFDRMEKFVRIVEAAHGINPSIGRGP